MLIAENIEISIFVVKETQKDPYIRLGDPFCETYCVWVKLIMSRESPLWAHQRRTFRMTDIHSLKFIRLLRVLFSSQLTEGVLTTRSNRMKFRLWYPWKCCDTNQRVKKYKNCTEMHLWFSVDLNATVFDFIYPALTEPPHKAKTYPMHLARENFDEDVSYKEVFPQGYCS